MKKSLTCLLVALLILGLISGCTGQTPVVSPSANPVQSESPDGESTYPIVNDGSIELSTFWVMNSEQSKVATDLNDLAAFKEMGERTGIRMKYNTPSIGNEQTSFQLMIASSDYDDIFYNGQDYYSGGAQKLYNDGIIIDLSSLMEENAPNIWKILMNDKDKYRDSMTDEGLRLGMPKVTVEDAEPAWGGLVVREDLLKEQGMALPKTIADWDKMLQMFKDEYNMEKPLINNFTLPYYPWSYDIASAYDVSQTFIVVDGKVKYGPNEDGWKEYMTLMSDWYARGLFDNDFASRDTTDFWCMGDFSNGVTGAGWNAWGNALDMLYVNGYVTDPNFLLSAVPAPIKDENSPVHIRMVSNKVLGYGLISSTNEYIEESILWLDYLNSEEGMLLSMYGIEGVSYTLENGKPVFNDHFINEMETPEIAKATYTMYEAPGLYDYQRNYQMYEKDVIDQCLVWNSSDYSYNMPSAITFTEDESNRSSVIMTDIDTYMQEMASKFVSGRASLDTEWDAYIKQLETMGINEVIAIQQAAYDRYIAR